MLGYKGEYAFGQLLL